MSERLVFRPPEQAETDLPIIFIAGPVQGTSNWQSRAIELIHEVKPDALIASPRRDVLDEEFDYNEQVNWETLHLRRAGRNGVIMFWLARETEPIPGRAYAQTTRFELAEWATQHKYMRARIVVGIEEGFSGAKYVRKRLKESPEIPILESLEETCLAAVDNLRK